MIYDGNYSDRSSVLRSRIVSAFERVLLIHRGGLGEEGRGVEEGRGEGEGGEGLGGDRGEGDDGTTAELAMEEEEEEDEEEQGQEAGKGSTRAMRGEEG